LKAACWGNNWKNNSTEKQFVKSEENGVLTGNGSSRWKQRAYYDFLKDISGRIMKIPMIRISIYDDYKNVTVDGLLKNSNDKLLYELISTKIK
jgi:hypothetical protein